MAVVKLDRLCKSYEPGGALAVDSVSLTIEDGEFMVLLGPSGCGKSTTLRMIAGLESITSGELSIDGKVMNRIPAKDRDIAMVFQSYALYPHMTVRNNLAFGLKRRGIPSAEIAERVAAAAEMLHLTPYLNRKPNALSGGQRQRVALGRAIVRNPKVFLLDEPLSNLDAALRLSTRGELIKQHRQLHTTMIYVTHDQVEAMTMGTRLCIMNEGKMVQVGRPMDIYRHPADTFVARFLGSPGMNLARVTLSGSTGGPAIRLGGQELPLPRGPASDRLKLGGEIIFGIRPEDLHLASGLKPDLDTEPLMAIVSAVEPLGAETLLLLEIPGLGEEMMARIAGEVAIELGERVEFRADMRAVRLFDPTSGLALA